MSETARARVMFVCGRYEGGMRDHHLALMREWGDCEAVSVVRVTRSDESTDVEAEHRLHRARLAHAVFTTSQLARHAFKALPLFPLIVAWHWMKERPTRTVVTSEGFCFWAVPSFVLGRVASAYYHDPEPHESAATGWKHRFEIRYRRWVHERKRWVSVMVGSETFVESVGRRAKAPVEFVEFPRLSRLLYPPSPMPSEAIAPGYVLVYGRVDRYKGIYEWLCSVADDLGRLPSVVIAGRVVDERVKEFADRVTIIDRYIRLGEVWGLFENAAAVVMPYRSVTHSGVGDIALSFDRPTYFSELAYFDRRYAGQDDARPLDAFLAEMAGPDASAGP